MGAVDQPHFASFTHQNHVSFSLGATAIILALSLGLPSPSVFADSKNTPTTDGIGNSDPFSPQGRQFSLLNEELSRYQALAASDSWKPLSSGQPIAPGSRGPRVSHLRSLLMLYGDYRPEEFDPVNSEAQTYDKNLQSAVKRFQKRHGLKQDALVDERTRSRLNTPPRKIAAILSANIERWKQLPKDLGPRYIIVNIPAFNLRLIEGNKEQFRMRVVVGKAKHKTPQLATRMTRLEFNPVWRVPPNIALRELLPKGSSALRAKGYRLMNHRGRSVPFTRGNVAAVRRGQVSLQQKGGPGNALGRVKFIIPNRQAIFLHDTNSKHLFKKSQRAFSHGCIRLEKPMQFARMMLSQQNSWNDARINRTLASGRTHGVALKKTLPVYIAYWTAWVDENGQLQFRPDIYNRDQR
ncbi:L,D-transpeptidase family protein [Microbulbifer sp. OS29]|uniref:L,D-transpeptidase family protein n=1 Tax=Microbulbifer okhotskensis TaxID=2926617 RepID=A0A9X2J4I9_9GAMM|nr:L,D-transpeptidase family protein [Microbulbifer okhotskensis]MCO1333389.1 L,D-transpeptidase family protein [Microbulbifer okhotskensis]